MLRTFLIAAALIAPAAASAETVNDTHVDLSMPGKTVKLYAPKHRRATCGTTNVHHQAGKTTTPMKLASDRDCANELAAADRAERKE